MVRCLFIDELDVFVEKVLVHGGGTQKIENGKSPQEPRTFNPLTHHSPPFFGLDEWMDEREGLR